ncbi:hypothetical protein HRbin14_02118 [bacterium HR14]|nr:hypothetical protein HRbin14_02118 [bacterium HR14]
MEDKPALAQVAVRPRLWLHKRVDGRDDPVPVLVGQFAHPLARGHALVKVVQIEQVPLLFGARFALGHQKNAQGTPVAQGMLQSQSRVRQPIARKQQPTRALRVSIQRLTLCMHLKEQYRLAPFPVALNPIGEDRLVDRVGDGRGKRVRAALNPKCAGVWRLHSASIPQRAAGRGAWGSTVACAGGSVCRVRVVPGCV